MVCKVFFGVGVVVKIVVRGFLAYDLVGFWSIVFVVGRVGDLRIEE